MPGTPMDRHEHDEDEEHPAPERLRPIPLFADLSDEDLARVATWFSVDEVSEGHRFTPEGAAGYRFYVIEDGTVEVRHHDEAIATLGPGDFFGEMAIMGDGRRVADVVATSPMTIFEMFGTSFRELEAGMPDVAARLRAVVEERMP